MSRAWSKGSSRAWRRVRVFVLARDGYRCRLRLAVCLGEATQAHHIAPREIIGDDPEFLIATCKPCNLSFGNPARRPEPQPRPSTLW